MKDSTKVEYEPDCGSAYSWDNCEGHGPVRRTGSRHTEHHSGKKPGERPLNQPGRREYQFYYDWREAMQMARRDGWNTKPYDGPNKALRAVQADFDYLRQFLSGQWEYVIVTVTLGTGESESLCGVETFNNYHHTVAQELETELLAEHARTVANLELDYEAL